VWQVLTGEWLLLLLVDFDSLLPDISVQNMIVFLLHMFDVVLQKVAAPSANHGGASILDAEILGTTSFATVFGCFFAFEGPKIV
jgi:hypothetical protein